MMTMADIPAGGLALFLLLGLRHGVEPDHIAAIDGLTLRAIDKHERHAPWTGTLFALGHGAAIAVLAVGVSLLATSIALPDGLLAVVDWLPVILLALLGVWNLRALLAPGPYQPSSLRMRLMPARLRERVHDQREQHADRDGCPHVRALAHVSAWSVFATHQGGWVAGVVAGALFSAGMLVTSTADSQLLCRLLRSDNAEAVQLRYRRAVGWFVVVLSFGVALHGLGARLGWFEHVDETVAAWLGSASIPVVVLLWWWVRRRRALAVQAP